MKKIIQLSVFVFLSFACNVNPKVLSKEESSALSADFIEFYEKFHNDSLYQIRHCLFPMEGLPDQADSTVNVKEFRWTEKTWKMHHALSDSTGLVKSFSKLGENMITERMLDEKQGLGMERRFAKMGNEWNLIYYVGLNQYKRN